MTTLTLAPFLPCSSSVKHLPLRLAAHASTQLSPTSLKQQLSDQKTGVIVIGAGLAGLAAATRLNSQNIPFVLLEASDAVGGRVRTDVVDGFLLDRGFQIFITAYPEAQKLLDYQALELQKFYSGARIYFDGQFHTVADPLCHFFDSVKSLANPHRICCRQIAYRADKDSVERFFQPFYGGIFFDRDLGTTSRLFDFIFKCLALGDNTLPAKGIGAIPNQLASKLPPDSISLNTRVVSVGLDKDQTTSMPFVRLENGDVLQSELGVIVAIEEPHVNELLAETSVIEPVQSKRPARSTVCLYFSADRDGIPVRDPVLFLNGSGKGIVNNMFFATNVAPSYGPLGKALVSVSLIGLFDDRSDADLIDEVILELSGWFGGSVVGSWKHLRTYRIGYAQPNQCPPTDLMKNPKIGPGLYLCGDHLTSATFDGALASGRRAAEALLRDGAFIKV
ncbi:FAD/NAD(P)-BINDING OXIDOREDUCTASE FAMILY PROTEIN [Salix purpurea]|uniref:FAD/NAD(P)-BINDING OXIDOREDUCTASE FAMILY PROTEIN n=1 Tax=Salix purpurea TaxID=77065 RepID=A0A9Q1A1C0_SALPP|nr:FAD/NAD(P)-BINDING OXIDOREDUCTASE FAMILY PROTEIN [Salix purpurea]